MYGKKIFGLFVIGALFLSIGLYLGQRSPRNPQNKIQSKPSITTRQNVLSQSVLSPTPSSNSAVLSSTKQGSKVIKVVDGDTIKVEINDKKETVRLIGIDSPETVDPRKPVQCFGKEASDKAKEVLNDQFITLEKDETQGERDKYGRLLRYIFLDDDTNFNKLMIDEGFAHEYTYRIPYKYQKEFKQAEKEAREAKRGLWADNTCSFKLKPAF